MTLTIDHRGRLRTRIGTTWGWRAGCYLYLLRAPSCRLRARLEALAPGATILVAPCRVATLAGWL